MTTSVGVAGRRWVRNPDVNVCNARQGLDLGLATRAAFPSIYPLIHDQLSAVPAGKGQADRPIHPAR